MADVPVDASLPFVLSEAVLRGVEVRTTATAAIPQQRGVSSRFCGRPRESSSDY